MCAIFGAESADLGCHAVFLASHGGATLSLRNGCSPTQDCHWPHSHQLLSPGQCPQPPRRTQSRHARHQHCFCSGCCEPSSAVARCRVCSHRAPIRAPALCGPRGAPSTRAAWGPPRRERSALVGASSIECGAGSVALGPTNFGAGSADRGGTVESRMAPAEIQPDGPNLRGQVNRCRGWFGRNSGGPKNLRLVQPESGFVRPLTAGGHCRLRGWFDQLLGGFEPSWDGFDAGLARPGLIRPKSGVLARFFADVRHIAGGVLDEQGRVGVRHFSCSC